jgi:tellurite resistance protein TerC
MAEVTRRPYMGEVMPNIESPLAWGIFVAVVVVMLALDLGVFHRKAHVVGFREAGIWSAVWMTLALLFCGFVWQTKGSIAGMEFLSGYLIEMSLSVDNIFVFIVVFSAMGIPAIHQHRVLFWGILTAVVLRGVMIGVGVAMLTRFHWLIYVFGAFLIFTGAKLFWSWYKDAEEHPDGGSILRLVRRVLPTTPALHGEKFFVKENAKYLATPLFTALVLVEISDVVFALDSIPAIFAITTDPFIVFTSNIFAILGLRSMFFLVAGMVDRFHYLKVGLSGVLVFVGTKMSIVDFFKITPAISLIVIAALLGGSIIASLLRPHAGQKHAGEKPAEAAGKPATNG